MDIGVFNGDPMEYQHFMATLREAVENEIADPMHSGPDNDFLGHKSFKA